MLSNMPHSLSRSFPRLCAFLVLCFTGANLAGQSPVPTPKKSLFSQAFDCGGIQIRSTASVKPETVQAACKKLDRMLAHLPQARKNLSAFGAELEIAALDNSLDHIPWHATTPRMFQNAYLMAACSEENIKATAADPTVRDQCVEGFARVILYSFGFGVRSEVFTTSEAAYKQQLWKGAFPYLNYWPELSLWYFGGQGGQPSGKEIAPGPDALKDYDPKGFAILDKLYSGKEEPLPVTLLPNAILVSSAEGQSLSVVKDWHYMVVVNETKDKFVASSVSRMGAVAFWENSTAMQAVRRYEAPPYSRQVINMIPADVLVVADASGKEVGRYRLSSGTSVLELGK